MLFRGSCHGYEKTGLAGRGDTLAKAYFSQHCGRLEEAITV